MEVKKKQIDQIIANQNIPNLLFYGPYANGKEDLCKYFIHCLYGNKHIDPKYILVINCLQTNGIQSMKQNIKMFSMQIIQKTADITFKTILLKHADYLTHDAQYSLRRNIETYSHNTRFVILCESKIRLLSPIRSRFIDIYVNIPYTKKILQECETFRYKKYNDLNNKYRKLNEDKAPFYEYAELAKEFYEHHYCAYDILSRFKKHERYHEAKYLFDKYKYVYNNEEMCILFILNVFRNKSNIQIFRT